MFPQQAFSEHAVAGNHDERWEPMMQIGKPLRTIVVEPVEYPVLESAPDPNLESPYAPQAPEPEPEQVPAKQ